MREGRNGGTESWSMREGGLGMEEWVCVDDDGTTTFIDGEVRCSVIHKLRVV